MRVVATVDSYKILQVEKTPPDGEANPFNGRFAMPVPDGADANVDDTTYILPQDGGDLGYQLAQNLLARFPMYSHVMFNFLLEDSDIADLDLTALGPGGIITRAQVGRGVGPGPLGQVPNTTAVLPQNNKVAPPRPGCLVTSMFDIGPVTGFVGADEFMVWWYIWEFDTTHDVASDYGMTLGQNDPAYRQITEVDQEPGDFYVYISHDNGVTWTPTGRQEPTDLIVFNTQVRLAFVNVGSSKIYLAAFAFLF